MSRLLSSDHAQPRTKFPTVPEGNPNFLNALYPMPSISKVLLDPLEGLELFSFGNVNPMAPPVFREDSFDPTTRVRRGRFYVPVHPTLRDWQASRVNHYPYAHPIAGAPVSYSLDCYSSLQPKPIYPARLSLVLLGDRNYHTAWHIVGAERLFNAETFFTLRAADTLGLLPDLKEAAIPASHLARIRAGLASVADAAFKYLPSPIVDVCRECARIILAAWLPTIGVSSDAQDLAALIRNVPPERDQVVSTTRLINRFHPRGKSAEREKQAIRGNELREVSAEDAEISIGLIGLLLREVGWAT